MGERFVDGFEISGNIKRKMGNAVALATDIDANATVTITGTVKLTWVNLS